MKSSDAEALSAYYNLTPDLPANLFWTNATRLPGDFAFNEPASKLIHSLPTTSNNNHKIYRYQVCLSNPFPGSVYSYVPGHHFVELMYLFLTYLERYPPHRDNFFARVAKDLALRWISFANGRAPWDEYSKDSGYKIAIFDDLRGIDVRTREQDERVSKEDVWGEEV